MRHAFLVLVLIAVAATGEQTSLEKRAEAATGRLLGDTAQTSRACFTRA